LERVLFLSLAPVVALIGFVAGIPNVSWSWVAVAAAVVALGVPHGALDTAVARTHFGLSGVRGVARFVAIYVGLAFLVAGVWFAAPVWALSAFLAYAALHFGQDWTHRPAEAFVLGAALIALPAIRFEAEVAAIFAAMTGDGAAVASVLSAAAPFVGVAAFLVALRHGAAALEIVAYSAVALAAPPHVAFAVYFCALHSPRHFRETAESLGLSTRQAVGASLAWTVPVVIAGIAATLLFVRAGEAVPDVLARVIFVGLACLTVPHMLLEMTVERPAWLARVRRLVGRQPAMEETAASTRSGVAGASRW
jgi:Brp/Blh family beta-carotene 15,15'-monooxygenase